LSDIDTGVETRFIPAIRTAGSNAAVLRTAPAARRSAA
jgi:hypothetical protein